MAAPRLLQPGDLLGKYRVEKVLGFGGMGVVYRAVDTTLPRLRVAIKVLSLVHDANMVARFKREADVLADITSRHVVQIFGTGTVDFPASEGAEAETVPYIVMELLRGHDLTDLLVKERRLSVERAVDIMLGVLSALRACHEQGIIHRDVKPKNIFLHHGNEGETVKLVDFGVSLMPFGSEITGINGVAGTKEYMSPEHASLKTIDARSDQFSAAVVLYGCLAGGLPWPKTTDFTTHVRRLLAGTYDRLEERRPDLPKTLIDVIDRGLKVSPDDRFPSVRDMGESLLPFASPIGRGLFRSVLEVRRRPEQSGPVPVRPASTGMPTSPEKPVKTTDQAVSEQVDPISVVIESSSGREPKSPPAIAPIESAGVRRQALRKGIGNRIPLIAGVAVVVAVFATIVAMRGARQNGMTKIEPASQARPTSNVAVKLQADAAAAGGRIGSSSAAPIGHHALSAQSASHKDAGGPRADETVQGRSDGQRSSGTAGKRRRKPVQYTPEGSAILR
jgi:serine/threonine protein kinase